MRRELSAAGEFTRWQNPRIAGTHTLVSNGCRRPWVYAADSGRGASSPPSMNSRVPCDSGMAESPHCRYSWVCAAVSRCGTNSPTPSNADYDGDPFAWSNDPRLLAFCDATPDGRSVEALNQAVAGVEDRLQKAPKKPVTSAHGFSQFFLTADTTPVKGIACAIAEKAFHAAFVSLDPMGDGSFLKAIELSACAHASNDCRRNFSRRRSLRWRASCCRNLGCLAMRLAVPRARGPD